MHILGNANTPSLRGNFSELLKRAIPHSPYLKEHFGPHAEETVDYAERKNHRHAVDVSTMAHSSFRSKYFGKRRNTYKLRNHGNDATDS